MEQELCEFASTECCMMLSCCGPDGAPDGGQTSSFLSLWSKHSPLSVLACLRREVTTCVSELVQCVANKTCTMLHPGGLDFFLSSLVVSVDLTKPLRQKTCGCSMYKKLAIASR